MKQAEHHFRFGLSLVILFVLAISGSWVMPEVRIVSIILAVVMILVWIYSVVMRQKEKRDEDMIQRVENSLGDVWPLNTAAVMMSKNKLELRLRQVDGRWNATYIGVGKGVTRIEANGSSSVLTRAIERAGKDLKRKLK